MKSIYHRLTLYIVPCFAIFWLLCSLVVYFSVRQSLLKTIDAELVALIRPIRIGYPNETFAPKHTGTLAGIGEHGSGTYFQLWNEHKVTIRKSPSLGEMSLPFPGEIKQQPTLTNLTIAGSDPVRAVVTVGPGKPTGRGNLVSRVTIVVAKSLKPMQQTMRSWLLGLILGSFVVLGLATFLIRLSLKAGLKPLDNLTSGASEIDAGSLEMRFDPHQMPGELRPIAGALNDLLCRLEQSFDRERRISADLAHELRTPVATLKSLGQVALKWPEQASPEDYQDVCEISNSMSEIIESILLLGRLEDGREMAESTLVDLRNLTDQFVEDSSAAATESGVKINLYSTGENTVVTDRNLIGIVISNLLRNSINHAPANSVIDIELGSPDHLFKISNPAPDLKPADLPHLFERYWKGDESRTGQKTSGLGLSIARSAAERIGLQLDADLDENNRITFLLSSQKVSLT